MFLATDIIWGAWWHSLASPPEILQWQMLGHLVAMSAQQGQWTEHILKAPWRNSTKEEASGTPGAQGQKWVLMAVGELTPPVLPNTQGLSTVGIFPFAQPPHLSIHPLLAPSTE